MYMSFLYWSVTGCSVTFDHQTLTVNFYCGIFLPSPVRWLCRLVRSVYRLVRSLSWLARLLCWLVIYSRMQENKSLKSVLALLMPYKQQQDYLTSQHKDLTSRYHYLTSWHHIWKVDMIVWKDDFLKNYAVLWENYVDLSDNYINLSDNKLTSRCQLMILTQYRNKIFSF